jgi:hypothetical protein
MRSQRSVFVLLEGHGVAVHPANSISATKVGLSQRMLRSCCGALVPPKGLVSHGVGVFRMPMALNPVTAPDPLERQSLSLHNTGDAIWRKVYVA